MALATVLLTHAVWGSDTDASRQWSSSGITSLVYMISGAISVIFGVSFLPSLAQNSCAWPVVSPLPPTIMSVSLNSATMSWRNTRVASLSTHTNSVAPGMSHSAFASLRVCLFRYLFHAKTLIAG